MGTILDSTKELSKKLGVEADEQTIKDQIDAINESIDENFGGSIDIAEAVRTYSENAGGGDSGDFNSLIATFSEYSGSTATNGKVVILRSSTGEYEFAVEDDTIYVLADPAVTIHITGVNVDGDPIINAISFVAGADAREPGASQGNIKIDVNNGEYNWHSAGNTFSEGDPLVAKINCYGSPGERYATIRVTNEGVTSHTVVIS